MAKVDVYKIDGSKTETFELPDHLFKVKASNDIVAEALRAQEANSRITYADTKDRSEVRGGGRKPWKQKGTGRARHGSSRSPIWIGGGVTFGPTKFRNFTLKINKKARKKALAVVLSDKVSSGLLIVVEGLSDVNATSVAAKMRKALPGSDSSAVIVCAGDEKVAVRASRNLPKTGSIAAHSLNVRDLLKYEYVIASKAAVQKMIEVYA
ncbi:50S ribosomal protein L4 [Candidatus Uhrbacteria bacterium]|jgi:large subunit ribosomal protein L4|nr:50S ribosomal protein L4 [Candidatus Uhrbacteria bacterium]MBT7717097.1 50S ribosomal protein L4 [Candidatus Uhrbacteria bacterium]